MVNTDIAVLPSTGIPRRWQQEHGAFGMDSNVAVDVLLPANESRAKLVIGGNVDPVHAKVFNEVLPGSVTIDSIS